MSNTTDVPDPRLLARFGMEQSASLATLAVSRSRDADPNLPGGLEQVSIALDAILFALAGAEAASEVGLTRLEEIESNKDKWFQVFSALVGVPLEERVRAIIAKHPEIQNSSHSPVGSIADVLAIVRTIAEMVMRLADSEQVERLIAEEPDPNIAHRVRESLTQLRYVLRRLTSSQANHRLLVAGRAYSEGRLTLREVGRLLCTTAEDTIASLEEHGFSRQPDVIKLTNEDRKAALSDIAQHLVKRQSAERDHLDLLWREVVASQRIEGVDARSWKPLIQQ